MNDFSWQRLSLVERIRWLRFVLPPALVIIVASYQLGVAQWLSDQYGHPVHYAFEIAFYSLTGPVASWLTLVWVERSLRDKEALEREVQARTQQLASLTEASADAILSVDESGRIVSWNRGAERMLGYSAEQAIGSTLDLFLPHPPSPAAHPQGAVQNADTEARARDGRILKINYTQTRLPQKDGSASLLIMRDVTARREREAIIEEERSRIARDLHDGVAQTLYFAALQADMGRQQLAHDPQEAVATIGEVGAKVRQVIRDVRRTIFALRPLDWTEGTFLEALQRFARGFSEQMGWQLHMDVAASSLAVPPRLQPTLFRLVQESMNNVAKHAQASHVWLTVASGENGSLQLTLRDDGKGFDEDEVQSGLGLEQMQARVQRSGGRMTIETVRGKGTTIHATLPAGGENGG